MTTKPIEQQPSDYYYNLYFFRKGIHHWLSKKRVDDTLRFIPKGKRILDAGCGCGVLSKLLENPGYIGVDMDAGAIEFARKNIACGTYICADLKTFSYDGAFDVIYSSNVLEHFVKEDRKAILLVLDKRLVQGGKMVLIVPSFFYIRIIEGFFMMLRKISDPGLAFDDEGIHEVVDLNKELTNALPGYRIVEQGLLTFMTMSYVVAEKLGT
jgi:SAM-dependent methyltransferase